MLLSLGEISPLKKLETHARITLCNWMLWRKDQLKKALRKKHKSIIITGLKDTWLEITGS